MSMTPEDHQLTRRKGRFRGPFEVLRRGVTLVELMIASAIISIGILAMVQSFGFIQKAIQASKNRTLSSNLAQEKMQILKQKEYYQVLVTTDPSHNSTDFDPEVIDYDSGYFPPEVVSEAGVSYTRYTYVQVVREDSGSMVTLPATTPDTGMKLITVTVTWQQGGRNRKTTVRSIMANMDTVMANATFNGQVRDSLSLAGISGAVVNVAENMGWRDTSGISGAYSISLSPGNFTLVVSADGYYTQVRPVSIAANGTQTQDFSLVKIATGAVSGAVWLRDHLVISQVVGSSVNVQGYDQEYVEIYNPTTYTWLVDGEIGLKYQRAGTASSDEIEIDFHTGSVPSGGYYLFSNTGTVTAGGVSRAADAVWDSGNSVSDFPDFADQQNIIRVSDEGVGEGGGALALFSTDSGAILDVVGWDKNDAAKEAPFYETQGIDQGIGLQRGEQYARIAGTSGISSVYGPAYDSQDNDRDFHDQIPISLAPSNSSITKPVISGTPAAGALVTCSDGVSSSTEAWLTGAIPYSTFTLVNVATGTWTIIISSGIYGLQHDTVTVLTAGQVFSFASTTTLDQQMDGALITGRVLGATGLAITPSILLNSGGMGPPAYASASTGRYSMRVSTGILDVTANPTIGGTPSYITLSSAGIAVETGEVHSGVDFVLYQGGKISGYITRDGINPLPGVSVAMIDVNGIARDQQATGLDGKFTSVNLSTGDYKVMPVVGSHEDVYPSSASVSLITPGVTKFSSTFTVVGAMGYISGAVSSGGEPIKTGVLIVVTTTTLSGTPPAPPALDSSTLSGPPYYLVSSLETGSYLAEVRGSTSPAYNVYAYFSTPSGTGANLQYAVVSGVQVSAGQTTSGVNFSW